MFKTNLKVIHLILLLCFCLLGFTQDRQKQSTISGTIKLDSTWSSKIYLSLIPTFNKMYTMSNTMIVSSTHIDNEGNFEFDLSFLPKEQRLYRIHIAKKDAPPASLIIGGKDENHLFLFANNSSQINVAKQNTTMPFNTAEVSGSNSCIAIKQINTIESYMNDTHIEDTYLKREFVSKGVNEKLRFIADTSTNALVSLYALYKSKYETNYEINKQFYIDYLDKWKANESSYFSAFRKTLPNTIQKKSYISVIIGVICFVIGILISYYVFVIRKSNKIQALSVQERKIFSAIKDGKSNKEISEEYNIGINTVKSHIKNIYSKLGLKSRKEAIDF